jgi:flagellar biogenesis protein FliO
MPIPPPRLRLVIACVTLLLLIVPAASGDAFDDVPLRAGDGAIDPNNLDSPAVATTTGPSLTRILGSLAVVAVLIVALGFGYRRLTATTNRAGGAAVTLISRTVLTPKHQVMVLKVGRRLVVVGDAGHGMQALSEVSDPDEVTEVLAAAGRAEAVDDPVKADAFSASYEAAVNDGFDPLAQTEPADVQSVLEDLRKNQFTRSVDRTEAA